MYIYIYIHVYMIYIYIFIVHNIAEHNITYIRSNAFRISWRMIDWTKSIQFNSIQLGGVSLDITTQYGVAQKIGDTTRRGHRPSVRRELPVFCAAGFSLNLCFRTRGYSLKMGSQNKIRWMCWPKEISSWSWSYSWRRGSRMQPLSVEV